MLFIIIPLSVILLGVNVYFALSPKSSRGLRLAALAALGASMLAVLICGIILVAGMKRVDEEAAMMMDFLEAEPLPVRAAGNDVALIVVAIILLAFLGTVVVLSLRERRRQEDRRKGAGL